MVGQNLMHRARADGTLNPGHRRLLCCGYSHGNRCPVPGSTSIVPVERAVLAYCSDQLNLSALLSGDGREIALRAQLAALRAEIGDTERQISRVTEAMLADDTPPVAFARKARELESTLAALTHAMDREARLKVRQLVADTFARITIYHAGANLNTDGLRPIEVQLIAKTGRARTLYVNRKTGAFTAAEDYVPTAAPQQ